MHWSIYHDEAINNCNWIGLNMRDMSAHSAFSLSLFLSLLICFLPVDRRIHLLSTSSLPLSFLLVQLQTPSIETVCLPPAETGPSKRKEKSFLVPAAHTFQTSVQGRGGEREGGVEYREWRWSRNGDQKGKWFSRKQERFVDGLSWVEFAKSSSPSISGTSTVVSSRSLTLIAQFSHWRSRGSEPLQGDGNIPFRIFTESSFCPSYIDICLSVSSSVPFIIRKRKGKTKEKGKEEGADEKHEETNQTNRRATIQKIRNER